MSRSCTVCAHGQRGAVEAALVELVPYRHIAARFGVSTQALQRHKQDHLPPRLARAQEASQVAEAGELLRQVRALTGRAVRLLTAAEAAGDLRTALAGVGQARACLELLARLQGELDERPVVTLSLSPEWAALRSVILAALAPGPYTAARLAVAAAIAAHERGRAGDDDRG